MERVYGYHAMARLEDTYPYIYYFIDINGEITNEGIDFDNIRHTSDAKQAYFNSFKGNAKKYEYVLNLDEYLNQFYGLTHDFDKENIKNLFVVSIGDRKMIVDINGKVPDNIKMPDNISGFSTVSALYLNTILKENKYEYLYNNFKDANLYTAGYSGDVFVFINKKTHELDLGDIKIEDFNGWDYESREFGTKRNNSSAYFNTLFKTNKFARFHMNYSENKNGYILNTTNENWYI